MRRIERIGLIFLSGGFGGAAEIEGFEAGAEGGGL